MFHSVSLHVRSVYCSFLTLTFPSFDTVEESLARYSLPLFMWNDTRKVQGKRPKPRPLRTHAADRPTDANCDCIFGKGRNAVGAPRALDQ